VKQVRNQLQILIGNRFHVTLLIVSPYILLKYYKAVATRPVARF